MDLFSRVISPLPASMANQTHLKCLVGIILICILQVQSINYLEETCRSTNFSEKFLSAPNVSSRYSFVQYFAASGSGPYSTGVTCNLRIRLTPASYDLILSVKRVEFRVGYQDYLKIINDKQEIMMKASKFERDTEMQFYGKEFLLRYVTDAGGRVPSNYIGFALSLTIAQKDTCETPRGFRCHNGYCIDKYLTCDGTNNCGDFSDEDRCPRFQKGSDSSLGTVVLISMILMAAIGLVSGCVISMCLTTFVAEMMKMHRAGRRRIRTQSIESSGSSSSPRNLLERCF